MWKQSLVNAKIVCKKGNVLYIFV